MVTAAFILVGGLLPLILSSPPLTIMAPYAAEWTSVLGSRIAKPQARETGQLPSAQIHRVTWGGTRHNSLQNKGHIGITEAILDY